MRFGILFALALAWSVAEAQSRRAPPPAPLPAAEQGKQTSFRAAPVEKEGWTVFQFPTGGYAEWRTDEEEQSEHGGVEVVPAVPSPEEEVEPPARQQVAPAAPREMPRFAGEEACRPERQALARRLIELQGIDVDPVTAELLLHQLTTTVLPAWTRGGLPGPVSQPGWYGGQFLVNAASWDLWTRSLARELAECLADAS